jgi:pimeloyl-ACP methyl ester carboxylesterase
MNLFYRDKGTGFPVVILHGLYGCSDNWMYISRILSEKYRVIAVDCRNHGNSPHSDTHSYPEMVTDLAWLFHELEIEKAHLLGHSMGGKTAIAFAADYPENISSLAVVDIAPKNYLKTTSSGVQFEMNKRLMDVLINLDLTLFSNRNEIERAFERVVPEKFIRGFILKNLKRTGSGYEWKINVPVLKQNLIHLFSDVDIADYEDRLPMANYPVLFIRGGLSDYIQEEDYPIIRKMYPQAIISTIEGATHFLHAEKPDEFVEIYLNFLKTVH